MFQENTNNKPFTLALYLLLGMCSVLLFLKNAWVAEDAFILLRSVDQFLHGNGFRWNPHERTQVYTSPLWFLLIIGSTFLCKTLYINIISLSLLLHIALLAIIARRVASVWRWAAAVLLLSLSQGFFDFTASGLEYPLIYVLVAAFTLLYLRNRPREDRFWLALSAGLILVTRHDLLFLILPMLFHLAWQYRNTLTLRQQSTVVLLFAAPLGCWTVFSLLYYGFPFPNTAYAKLSIPGVPLDERLQRGMLYTLVSLKTDPVTPAVIAIALGKGLLSPVIQHRILSAGLALAFAYVTAIGGDYMIGRFYAPLYLVAVLTLVTGQWAKPFLNKPAAVLLALSCIYLLVMGLFIHVDTLQAILKNAGWPPLTSATPVIIACSVVGLLLAVISCLQPDYGRHGVAALFALLLFHSTQQNDSPWQTHYKDWGKTADHDYWWMIDTVSRERYWIYRWTSIYAWLQRDPHKPFPDHPWCQEGKAMPRVATVRFSGMMAYCMDNDHIAVDIQGLTDAFVARMPRNPQAPWLSGGVNRVIPEGYLESLAAGSNKIQDPDLALYYDKLALLTQSDQLLARERLSTLLAFNLGHFDALLEKHRRLVASWPSATNQE